MTHSVVHVVDAPALSRAQPAPSAQDAACTLTVTLRDSSGALGRIAATLSSTPVLALSYVVDATLATAEIRVPRAHAARARGKLNRMVDALAVTVAQATSTAG